MLKAPIEGKGIPNKGTSQGGILSPLLSNIVLNELDWWVSSQWETFETNFKYKDNSDKYKAIRKKTTLKEIYIVRYADDFKIMCRTRQDAENIFKAIKIWLKERLKLEISKEKSKIINLNKKYSEFLGFKIKVKGKKKVALSHILEKAKEKIHSQIKEQIKKIKNPPNVKNINKYNAMVLGIHNYYKIATHVSIDFSEIGYKLSRTLHNRLRMISTNSVNKTTTFNKFYGTYNCKVYTVNREYPKLYILPQKKLSNIR